MSNYWVFVGTSTNGASEGIYRFPFNAEAGTIGEVTLAAEAANPTFLAIHSGGDRLYAVNAVAGFQGERTGAVSAFALDRRSGGLSLLSQQPSAGAGPCHLVVDRA